MLANVLCLLVCLAPLILGATIEVTTTVGSVKGRILESRDGKGYFAFTKIPFAEPPIKKLRFMDPVPKKPWQGVIDATKSIPLCYQKKLHSQIVGKEDCLYLNVYSPRITSKLLPVIFSIYGGAFVMGNTGSASSSKYFMDEDIVLVTSNYRLGSFGFLSFEDNVVPGNMGLKDQALALEWTKREIASFGGDPDLITVIGESAGGASSHIICSSDRTNRLIKGCISQSGVGWSTWAIQPLGAARAKAIGFARAVGCTDRKPIRCLQSLPTKVAGDLDLIPLHEGTLLVGPVIEPYHTYNPILIDWPTRQTNFSWITGIVRDEGLIETLIYECKYEPEELIKEFIENFDHSVISELHLERRRYLLKKIKDRFFKKGLDPLVAIRNYCTESLFTYPALKALSRHKGPKYFYSFNYLSRTGKMCNISGIPHAAEMPFFFYKSEHLPGWPTKKDVLLSKTLVKLWCDFAKSLSPSNSEVSWSRFDEGGYLDIGNDVIVTKPIDKFKEIFKFWKEIF